MNDQISPIELKFKKINENAVLPKRTNILNSVGDTGYDLYAIEDSKIEKNSTKRIEVGLQISYITPGYWFRIESRSGLFFKNNITAFPGIIDNSYRGVLGIALTNHSSMDEYIVKKGDRIAQLVLYKLIEPVISWCDEIQSTERGANGFGSSGN